MRLSISEIKAIANLKSIEDIARALEISVSQAYRIKKNLKEKGIIDDSMKIQNRMHIILLARLLKRSEKIAIPFSGTGLDILKSLIEPTTIKKVCEKTGLHKTTVLKKINQARRLSLIIIEEKTYRINEEVWPDAREFLEELKRFEEKTDDRIPLDSIVYSKEGNEVLFSNEEELDATKTAFSAYENYGIKVYTTTNYYVIPKRKLTKREVFRHSLKIAKGNTNLLILAGVFYLRFKKELSTVDDETRKDLDKIISGKRMKGYPSFEEIKERSEMYG